MRSSIATIITCALLAAQRAFAQGCCCEVQPSGGCADTACRDTVCAFDSYCCQTQWDSICVNHASSACSVAVPYCLDANPQDGQPDVCSTGVNPADCNGDGLPDLQYPGLDGINSWIANPYGTQYFEPAQNWSKGRPGYLSDCRIVMPYAADYTYDYLEPRMGCDNVANSLLMTSTATAGQIRDFRLDMGGNTFAIHGSDTAPDLRFRGNGSSVIQRGYISNGTLSKPTVGPLEFWLDDMYQFQFDNMTLNAEGLIFLETAAQPDRWYLDLFKANFNVNSLVFALDPKRLDDNVETRLTLLQSQIDMTGLTASLEIPNYVDFFVETPLQQSPENSESRILLSSAGSLVLRGRDGSWRSSFTSLRGALEVQGTVAIAGAVDGLVHRYNGTGDLGTGSISATTLVYPAGPDASMRWLVDLSGASTLGPRIPLEATGSAEIGGLLWIDWTLNTQSPPQPNYAFTMLRNHGTWNGLGRNFDVVRVWPEILPDDFYVAVEWDGGTDLNLKVRQAEPISRTVGQSSPLATAPLKTCAFPLSGGTGTEIVTVTNFATAGISKVAVLDRNSSGQYIQLSETVLPANVKDMDTGDLDGDGKPELVTCHANPTSLRAYRFVNGGFQLMWARSYPQGTQLNCVAVVKAPGSGQKSDKMPTGASVATGKTAPTGESVEIVSGTGGSLESEDAVAGSSRTIRGTDIDNDDDADIVVGGSSGSTALKGGGNSGFNGFVQVLRSVNGQRSAELPIPTTGVPVDMDIGDLDEDGLSDVVIACQDFPPGATFTPGARPSAALLRGGGFGLRLPSPIDPGDPDAVGTSARIIDADDDGKPDIAVSWQGGNGGGACVFPIRARRAEGGVSLGRSVSIVAGRNVTSMTRDASGALVAIAAATGFTNGSDIIPTEFQAPGTPGDLDGSGCVDAGDIGSLLLLFGPCSAGAPCPGDLDGSMEVDAGDIGSLLLLFSGTCP